VADELLTRSPITRSELTGELKTLGVRAGSVAMVHCRLSSLGFVIGGLDSVVFAFEDILGPDGTLMALTGWEHDPYEVDGWPESARQAYLREPPVFDPNVSQAERDFGRLAERIRTWPGSVRSNHPEASFAALGARAEWLMAEQPWDHPYGPGSPLAKLVEANGDIVMVGAPLETVTALHYAEEMADVPEKKLVAYRAPIIVDGQIQWRVVNDIDTSNGAFAYEDVVTGNVDAFEVIVQEALAAGIGRRHKAREANLYLFSARDLVAFAVQWIEEHFAA
jgi:aminoglycoside 3-N-acetyltransferase